MLGIFFLSLYLLTMGGHLDSPDEELMFQVTRSLVERGSMDIGDTVLPERFALPGIDGRSYAPYGPVSSVLSVPFYLIGEAISASLPSRYSEVGYRFAVGLRDPVISAAACVAFYALAIELGFPTTIAILLSLALGGATLVWPYARHSFSEPVTGLWLLLSAFAAIRAVRSAGVTWSILSAAALGLAIGSKISTAVVLPGILVYLGAAGQGSWTTRIRRCVPFLLVLALPAAGLAILNYQRFGNPLETGYHLDGLIDLSHPNGIAGLLVSPGKSLFLYTPVAVLGLVGFLRLSARLPWEAALFFWLAASHVLAYGVLEIWHGDAAWGPRYLVPILPFVVLPAGALLAWTRGAAQRIAWAGFGVLFAVGLVVNLAGVLVDQRVVFEDLTAASGGNHAPTDAERWTPELSPVLIHWSEFTRRVSIFAAWWSHPVSAVSGTFGKESVDPVDAAEAARSELFPRWTSGDAVFELRNHGQPAQLTLTYFDNRPEDLGPNPVQIVVDGTPLPESEVTRTHADVPLPDKRVPLLVEARLDSAVVGHDSATVEIRSRPWQPARDAPPNPDIRQLGIQIWDLHFRSNGNDLAIGESQFSPMPVTDAQPWSYELLIWFYTPPHLADNWLWYLYLSGLPHWLMLLALVPVAGLLWSAMQLRRRVRSG